MKNDPYNDNKIIHLAKLISENGDISPHCVSKPRILNLRKEKWTTDPKAVTCIRCKEKSNAR